MLFFFLELEIDEGLYRGKGEGEGQNHEAAEEYGEEPRRHPFPQSHEGDTVGEAVSQAEDEEYTEPRSGQRASAWTVEQGVGTEHGHRVRHGGGPEENPGQAHPVQGQGRPQ